MQTAATNITRVSLELGGKSANVVFDDADLDAIVPSLWSFDNTGQDAARGLANSQRGLDSTALRGRNRRIAVGEPLDEAPRCTVDPRVSRPRSTISIGLKEGPDVTGGDASRVRLLPRPAVLAEVDNAWRVAQERSSARSSV
jgi:aldehyde dehydrogenase (NAD+)